ncbi:MAG: gluconokinase [Saprospiraceae bacterium]|nr:gluconokinase [Lewinella sp.]
MQHAEPPYFIGIDIGTSSAKSVAFSSHGEPLKEASEAYPLDRPETEAATQDAEVVFRAAMNSLRNLVQKMGYVPTAIGLSSAMHSLMAVDSDGHPLSPLITWADGRAQQQAELLRSTPLGMDLYHRSGTPVHAMSPLCKLAWLRNKKPELFQRAYRFIGIKEYLLFRLFGKWVIDHSIASATGMFDLNARSWIPDALQYAGLDAERLSDPVSVTFQLTDMQQDLATTLGIPPNIPWIIGASDGCLANLGAGDLPHDAAVLTIGTSGAIRMTVSQPVQDPEGRLFCYILNEDRYVIGGPSNNGGVVWEWFCRQFYPEKSMDEVFREVQRISPGAEGLLFLPYLYGERAPVWDAGARGYFWGIGAGHSRAHFARAVLEGICLNLYQITQALITLGGPIRLIHADGGFTQSPVWIQILANVLGIPLVVSSNPHASAKGAALLAMSATGHSPEMQDEQQENKVYTPEEKEHQSYKKIFERFKKIYPTVKAMEDDPNQPSAKVS